MDRTAILVVSFGSTHLDTLERCISSTEQAIAERFPQLPLYRAFSSNIVIRRLKEQAVDVDTIPEALKRMEADGITRAVVQPTLVLGGFEYDLIANYMKRCPQIDMELGQPLLTSEEDCSIIAKVLQAENPLQEGEALLLMGHGTEHQANEMYSLLQKKLDELKWNCVIGTVEGTPTFEDAVTALKERGVSKAKLLPLMFVAGDHAKNDMAGDDEDSLRSLVEAEGITAEPIIRGLGESAAIRGEYIRRTQEALERLNKRQVEQ